MKEHCAGREIYYFAVFACIEYKCGGFLILLRGYISLPYRALDWTAFSQSSLGAYIYLRSIAGFYELSICYTRTN